MFTFQFHPWVKVLGATAAEEKTQANKKKGKGEFFNILFQKHSYLCILSFVIKITEMIFNFFLSYTGQPDIPDTVAETALSEIIVEVEEEVEESLEVEKKVEEEVEQFSKVEEKKEKREKIPEVEMKTINTVVEVEKKIIVASEEKMEEISLHSEFEEDFDEGSAHREETSLRPESQVL